MRYMIIAYDNADNLAVEDNAGEYYIYPVIPEFSSLNILRALPYEDFSGNFFCS